MTDTSRTTLITSTTAQGGGDDGEQGGAEGEAERRNAAEPTSSRTTWIASAIAQGGGDDEEQGGAGGEAERRNAAEPATSWSTLINLTIAQGGGKRDRGAIGEESNPSLRATRKNMRGGARRKIPKQQSLFIETYPNMDVIRTPHPEAASYDTIRPGKDVKYIRGKVNQWVALAGVKGDRAR